MDYAVPTDHRVKLKKAKREVNIYTLQKNKTKTKTKTMELESDGDTNCNWCIWNNPRNISEGTRRHRNKISGELPDYNIIKIGQNTEKRVQEI